MKTNAVFKTLLCGLLTVTLLCGLLAGCAKTPQTPTEPTEATSAAPAALTAEKADFKAFRTLFHRIASYHDCMMLDASYNASSPDALPYALQSIENVFFPLFWAYAEKYGWNDAVKYYEGHYDETVGHMVFDEPDPLQLFETFAYEKIDGDKIDWMLTNVFGVEPDHNFNGYEPAEDGYSSAECYYYDGYYYYASGEGGDAGFEKVVVDAAKTDADNIYTLNVSAYEYGSNTVAAAYVVTAGLYDVDGHREWKILKIEPQNV